MRKIRKFLYAGTISYLPSIKMELPPVLKPLPLLNQNTVLAFTPQQSIKGYTKDLWLSKSGSPNSTNNSSSSIIKSSNAGKLSILNLVAAGGTQVVADALGNTVSGLIFDDSELGRGLGNIFSSGISTSADTIALNLFKGEALTQGLGQNLVASLSGTAAGLAGYGIGQGIRALGGDSKLSRGLGSGIATGIGSVGGAALQGALTGVKVGEDIAKGAQGALAGMKAINPLGLGMSMVGSGLQAALGPSKEYGGKYGNITRTMDSIYDVASIAPIFLPGGQVLSGALALNKGLSNLFGSTSGMTSTDAILGSAFMPAPVKWLNMAGAKTTGTFNNLSWQNTEKTNAFMGNAFGNLGDKFEKAREEARKTYGTFSQGAYNRALNNINFANTAWNKILAMADLNEILNIRSLYMTSINNQRYAQNIQGGWSPLARGKQGMKILNNATNHNIGMRLLSGAALIDNKQMILSAGNGTKIPKLLTAWDKLLTAHVLKNDNILTPLPLIIVPYERKLKPNEMMLNGLIVTIPETPQIGPDNSTLYLKEKDEQLLELDRKRFEKEKKLQEGTEKLEGVINGIFSIPSRTYGAVSDAVNGDKSFVESFVEGNKGLGDPTSNLLFDMFSPGIIGKGLLLGTRGFRWVFNKAGLLIKVPIKKITLETSFTIIPKNITSDIGELIGEGSERSVYTSKSNPNIVYKIEDAPLKDINNIEIRQEITDDIIAPETTIGYYTKDGKYYRVTQQDKYKGWDPDKFDIEYSPELDLEIINTLQKAGWKVELGTYNGAPYARSASKNGITLGNLEYYNWGRDSNGKLKLIDLYVSKLNLPKSDMKPFIDEYGRKIIPTPWKGTDQELLDLIPENQRLVLADYWSPTKKALVLKALGWGDKEYAEFLQELLRSIGILTKGEVKGPQDGFTIIAQHSGKAVGSGPEMKGLHVMTFNRERIPDEQTAIEAIIHEIGGHGKSMSIEPSKSSKISEAFPRLTELMLKNLELAELILQLNQRGKFFSLFPKVSDLELYLYNRNLHPKNAENLYNQRRYFLYMNKGILERAARAYTGLLMEKLGYDNTLNIRQLKRYYTPESVEEFKDAVLNYGVPLIVRGTTTATLYNQIK